MNKNEVYCKIILVLIMGLRPFFVQAQNYQAIAFYNVENLFDTINDPKKFDDDFTPAGSYRYTDKIYRKKLQNLSSVISKIANDNESKHKIKSGPAIIGLAEVENKQVISDLINQPDLKSRNYKIIHFESGDSRGIDVALIYRPDEFKVLQAQSVPVRYKYNGKNGYAREILYVRGLLADDTLNLLVNHWQSRRGNEQETAYKRNQSAIVCKRIADSLTAINTNAAVIIMGDLNDDPVNESIAKTLLAKGEKQKVNKREMFNPCFSLYKKGTGTCGHNDTWHFFDQIILSYGLINNHSKTWQHSDIEVFNRSFNRNQFGRYKGFPHRSFSGTRWIDGYSDHFPVVVYLKK